MSGAELRPAKPLKVPRSAMVLVYTPALQVLLIERADQPGFWQSVTGSQELGEPWLTTAMRELEEETGLAPAAESFEDWHIENEFLIYPQFRHRYPPGVERNLEHVFAVCVAQPVTVSLAPDEHLAQCWLPYASAAEKVRSWSNRDAILRLPQRQPQRQQSQR